MDGMLKKAKNTISGNKPQTRSNTNLTQNNEIASTNSINIGNSIVVEPPTEVGDTPREFYGDSVAAPNQISGENRLTKSLVEQQRKEQEVISNAQESIRYIASTSDSLYPKNGGNNASEQQLSENDIAETGLEDLRRKVADAKALDEAREKSFLISQLRQYEEKSRHFSSRDTYENKNGGRANNAAHI